MRRLEDRLPAAPRRTPTPRGWLLASPVLAIAFIPLFANWQFATRRGDTTTRDFAHDLLNSVEPYAIIVTAPLAFRRRFPSLVAIVVCASYFVAVSLHIPEIYVGNIAMFIAIYTVGAWVDDRRRAMLVRAVLIAGMFVWLLISTFQDATSCS